MNDHKTIETMCEWCEARVPLSKDLQRHESDFGVWACRNPGYEAAYASEEWNKP